MFGKPSKHASWKLFVGILFALVTSSPGALLADDYAHMIQFELRFGSKQPVSNLYMTMQPAGVENTFHFGTGIQPMIRTPVFSTDPQRMTLLRPISVLFATEESGTFPENESDENTSGEIADEHVGTAAGRLLGLVLIFAPIAIMMNDSANFDPCEDGCDVDLDIPEVPPDAAS